MNSIARTRSNKQASSRLFFAACPDDRTRTRLVRVQAGFNAGSARAVAADNLHLTLAFLGQVPAAGRECYMHAAAMLEVPRIDITLDRFGYFGKRLLCWFGPSAVPAELQTWQRLLQAAIAPCGYRVRRRFKPHVTLFRNAGSLATPAQVPVVKWQMDRFFLLESVPRDNGVVYLPIEEYRAC